jgi:hypothetical protein
MARSVALVVLVGLLGVTLVLYSHGKRQGGNWFTRPIVIRLPDWYVRLPTWIHFATAVALLAGAVALVAL